MEKKKKKPSSSKQTPKCSGHSSTSATAQPRRVAESPSMLKKLPPGWGQDINLTVLPLTDTSCKQTRLAVCMDTAALSDNALKTGRLD